MDMLALAFAGVVLVSAALVFWRRRKRSNTPLPFEERFKKFMASKAIIYVLLGLLLNTILAQAFFNSGGLILVSPSFSRWYLILSALGVTVSLSLFELTLVWTLNQMQGHSQQSGVKYKLSAWASRIVSLAIISLYNAYSIALLNDYLWPASGNFGQSPSLHGLPVPWDIPAIDWIHASLFSLILFLAGLVGEQKRSAAEEAAIFQDEMLSGLISNAREEVRNAQPGAAMTALTALAPAEVQKFMANYANALAGTISLQDVIEQMEIQGVIVPHAREGEDENVVPLFGNAAGVS